jgi:pimeloyl-ACP methyl ester carboxylesterase
MLVVHEMDARSRIEAKPKLRAPRGPTFAEGSVARVRVSGPKHKEKIKFDASRLAFVTGGAGEPAVFVHGFGSDKSAWQRVCHGLKDVFTFYAIDLPGSGDSPAPRHFHYTLEHLADVLTDFIIMKDLKKLTLVGASLGGTVVLLALLRNRSELQHRVRALCLIDAVAYSQQFPFLLDVLRTPILGPVALNLPFSVPLPLPVPGAPAILPLLADLLSPQYARRRVREALIETACLINAKHLARYVSRLKTIHFPTLVIWGRDDDVVHLGLGKRLARELPNSRLIIIGHCGHAPHQECPAKVIASLKQFIQGISDNISSKTAEIGSAVGPSGEHDLYGPGWRVGSPLQQLVHDHAKAHGDHEQNHARG